MCSGAGEAQHPEVRLDLIQVEHDPHVPLGHQFLQRRTALGKGHRKACCWSARGHRCRAGRRSRTPPGPRPAAPAGAATARTGRGCPARSRRTPRCRRSAPCRCARPAPRSRAQPAGCAPGERRPRPSRAAAEPSLRRSVDLLGLLRLDDVAVVSRPGVGLAPVTAPLGVVGAVLVDPVIGVGAEEVALRLDQRRRATVRPGCRRSRPARRRRPESGCRSGRRPRRPAARPPGRCRPRQRNSRRRAATAARDRARTPR